MDYNVQLNSDNPVSNVRVAMRDGYRVCLTVWNNDNHVSLTMESPEYEMLVTPAIDTNGGPIVGKQIVVRGVKRI